LFTGKIVMVNYAWEKYCRLVGRENRDVTTLGKKL